MVICSDIHRTHKREGTRTMKNAAKLILIPLYTRTAFSFTENYLLGDPHATPPWPLKDIA
jgi:hypothetical protein